MDLPDEDASNEDNIPERESHWHDGEKSLSSATTSLIRMWILATNELVVAARRNERRSNYWPDSCDNNRS